MEIGSFFCIKPVMQRLLCNAEAGIQHSRQLTIMRLAICYQEDSVIDCVCLPGHACHHTLRQLMRMDNILLSMWQASAIVFTCASLSDEACVSIINVIRGAYNMYAFTLLLISCLCAEFARMPMRPTCLHGPRITHVSCSCNSFAFNLLPLSRRVWYLLCWKNRLVGIFLRITSDRQVLASTVNACKPSFHGGLALVAYQSCMTWTCLHCCQSGVFKYAFRQLQKSCPMPNIRCMQHLFRP